MGILSCHLIWNLYRATAYLSANTGKKQTIFGCVTLKTFNSNFRRYGKEEDSLKVNFDGKRSGWR